MGPICGCQVETGMFVASKIQVHIKVLFCVSQNPLVVSGNLTNWLVLKKGTEKLCNANPSGVISNELAISLAHVFQQP